VSTTHSSTWVCGKPAAIEQWSLCRVTHPYRLVVRGNTAWEKWGGELLRGIPAACGRPKDLNGDRRESPILQEPLTGRGVVGLNERLMALLELRRCVGEGELIIIQPPLDVEMCLHQFLLVDSASSRLWCSQSSHGESAVGDRRPQSRSTYRPLRGRTRDTRAHQNGGGRD
jgi:hypothetical protein